MRGVHCTEGILFASKHRRVAKIENLHVSFVRKNEKNTCILRKVWYNKYRRFIFPEECA